jgi:hypothetical protein
LKRDALLTEQNPKALVADVVDHPLGDQEVGQLGQAPGRERQAVLDRRGLGDLLDLTAFGQGEGLGPSAPVLGLQRVEAVGVEVVDHIADPVGAGEGHLGNLRYGHALDRQQHHLRAPPGHHRSGAPTDDPQQSPAFVVVDLTDSYAFSHAVHHGGSVPSGAAAGRQFTTRRTLPDAALERSGIEKRRRPGRS